MRTIPPPHPGETIKEDFLVPLDMSVSALARELGVSTVRLNEIVLGRRGITAGTALRLARYFHTSADFRIGLPSILRTTHRRAQSGRDINKSVKPCRVAA